jgi:hypothetical protein
LRQVALVADDLEAVLAALRRELLVEAEPFRDPGVARFGLHNAVLAIGDTFLEIVSPVEADTTAGRYLERRGGDGGYMAIFQVADLPAARQRVADLGVRVVFQSDQPDIAGSHLHPRDVPGALVSIDWASPARTWRWAGPEWTGHVPRHAPGGIVGLTVQSDRPDDLADRWAAVLGRPTTPGPDECRVDLDGGGVRFVQPGDERGEGICALEIAAATPARKDVSVGGVRLTVRPLD